MESQIYIRVTVMGFAWKSLGKNYDIGLIINFSPNLTQLLETSFLCINKKKVNKWSQQFKLELVR